MILATLVALSEKLPLLSVSVSGGSMSQATRAYELIKLLLAANIIEPVKGQGKGKYHFINN